MEYVYATLLVLVNTAGLLLIVVGLPGTWLMVLMTALLAWWQSETGMISVWVVVAAAVLAALGEVVELISGAAGSKRAGGTRWGSVGALVGGLVGAVVGTLVIPVPIVGSILGVCGGAFLFAAIFESLFAGRTTEESLRSGQGAAVGRFVGILAKLGFGVAIWLVTAVAAFWP